MFSIEAVKVERIVNFSSLLGRKQKKLKDNRTLG